MSTVCRPLLTLLVLALALSPSAFAQTEDPPTAGPWVALFDGTSLDHWRGYRQSGFPTQGWVVEGEALRHVAGAGGGDLITRETYEHFELRFEFRVGPGANSGVMYRVTEEESTPWQTGPEFQVLDDRGHATADARHQAGSLYALYPAEGKRDLPPMVWREACIRQVGDVVEHWLDGRLLVRADLSSGDWKERVKASKFGTMPRFGVSRRGHLALQDHGDDAWYRNIRVRTLPAAEKGEVLLFDGKSLDAFTHYLRGDADPKSVWHVTEDGVIVCLGNPAGYLKTRSLFVNYELELKWRFSPVTKKAGNSGVLLRLHGEDKVWPKSVEAQLMSGNAGDFWNIGDFQMTVPEERTRGRNTKKLAFAENPVGEWNHYRILVQGGRVALWVNGQLLNEASEVQEIAGAIGLQSEGAEIHFKDLRLRLL